MVKCLTVEDARQVLNVSRTTIYALIRTPGFPASRVGRRWIVPADALDEWIKNGGTGQYGA